MSKSYLSRSIAFAAAAAFMLMPVSKAQEMTTVYMLDGGAFTNTLMANSLVERVETIVGTFDEGPTSNSKAAPKPGSLMFRTSAEFDTPRDMAAGYPADKRAEAEALFRKLLIMFADVEKQYGQSRHDLPTALALFIATSHEAASGQKIPANYGVPLVRQLRNALAADAAIMNASDADKQRLYEQLAIIGMMTGGTIMALEETPNREIATKLKTAGNGYLQQVLKLDPASIEFTNQGMQLIRR